MLLNFQDDPPSVTTRKMVEEKFDRKRAEGRLSKAHDIDHVIAVSNFAGVTARALAIGQGFDELVDRAPILGAVAGNLHDYHREAKETEPHGPASANAFLDMWLQGNTGFNTQEFDAVYRAIAHHEASLPELSEIFGDPIGQKQQILPAIVAFSLKTGDGILEASGYRVLERRAFFVGKERMQNGDLKGIFKYPEESDLAVIGESLRRLYGKLPIDSYPDWVKSYGEKLHSIQYKFLNGLLRYRGMDEARAASFMEEAGFPKFDGIKDKVREQRHLNGRYFPADRYPVLAERITWLRKLMDEEKDDLAEASHLLVETIAQADSPEEGIELYGKCAGLNTYANEFYNGMKGYREGSDASIGDFETDVTYALWKKIGAPKLRKGARR